MDINIVDCIIGIIMWSIIIGYIITSIFAFLVILIEFIRIKMKNLLIMAISLAFSSANAQVNIEPDSSESSHIMSFYTYEDNLRFNSSIKQASIVSFNLHNEDGKFEIYYDGDSLRVGGDLPISKSAKHFIDFCNGYINNKIDSLTTQLNNCENKIR